MRAWYVSGMAEGLPGSAEVGAIANGGIAVGGTDIVYSLWRHLLPSLHALRSLMG